MKRTLALTLALPLLATTALTAFPHATAASADRDLAERTRPTEFAMKARGFGSRTVGGDLPADSSTTAFENIGCTNEAGKERGNYEAEVTVPGFGVLSGVRTSLQTTSRDGVVASTSHQRIASAELAETPLGTLTVEAVRARASTFHDQQGFHAATVTEVGRLVLTPPVGDPQTLPLPTPDQPVVVPGVAEVSLGSRTERTSSSGSYAIAKGLVVKALPTGTKTTLALAQTRLGGGVRSGLFRGHSAGIRAEGLAGNVDKGRTPLSLMPCQGTGGKVKEKAIAGLDLAGNAEVGALTSQQWSEQTDRVARAWERGSVAEIDLGDGQLVVTGIVGQANLRRTSDGTTVSSEGSTVGTILADGEPQEFPDTGVLEIPGVARLEAEVVEKKNASIHVIGLRITVLDGTGAVIDLGIASVGVRRSGL